MKPVRNTEYKVLEDVQLLPYLMQKHGGSRTHIKSLLAHRLVFVNGTVQTRHDTPLHTGDRVVVTSGRGNAELKHPKLRLIYEDEYLLVVEKKRGLLTVPARANSDEMTVMSILKAYVRKQNQRAGVYVVHRLDRETSGLLVVAKSPEMQEYMRTYWKQLVTRRAYVAVAEGIFTPKEGQIRSWFTEDRHNAMVYSSPTDDGGDLAITHYEVLKENTETQLSLVELNLETGRTNQIRVHLASQGHPVVGDRKYGHGNTESPIDRLCLHARVLEFIHPATEQTVHFETPTPKEFMHLMQKQNQSC